MFNWIVTNTPLMLNQLWPKIESSITTNSKLSDFGTPAFVGLDQGMTPKMYLEEGIKALKLKSQKSKEELNSSSSSSNEDEKESSEPDCDEDKDQINKVNKNKKRKKLEKPFQL